MSHHVIAIDGPAASGKSSVSRKLAKTLDYAFLSSGLMYRAFTWAVLNEGLDPMNETAVVDLLGKTTFEARREGNEFTVYVNGCDPGSALTSDEVNSSVSHVAKIAAVRHVLVREQRALATLSDLVMEGRDIGSVVFPDTPHKFYLDASEEVRAQRRQAEGQDDSITERDRIDSSRKESPLTVAEGAIIINTSELTLNEVVEAVLQKLQAQGLST